MPRVEVVSPGLGAEDRSDAGAGRCSDPARRLIAKYTFEQFVIGRGNRFAHAAALAVAEQPGHAYNPLFIHGRPGLGKTHLLHAIGNYISRHGTGLNVRYATVEEFTTEFVQAVQTRNMTAFKESFRAVDVLLLDDVQFLAEKARTKEELFHTFNALRDSGKQLVMTSDRPPDELDSLEERLGERFGSGLVVALEPPDINVRRAILEKRARLDDVDADPDLLEEIAARVSTSVRALEAALIQVVAYASLRNEVPDAGARAPPAQAARSIPAGRPMQRERHRRRRRAGLRRPARAARSRATGGRPWLAPARSRCTWHAS